MSKCLGNAKNARLAIIDVGHGNAAVAEADGRVVIIDAGPRTGLLEYLLQEEIREVDLVFGVRPKWTT